MCPSCPLDFLCRITRYPSTRSRGQWQYGGDEDLALADYLEELLIGQANVDPQPYLQRVSQSSTGQKFQQWGPSFQADLQAALALDRFDFAMEVKREDAWPVIYPQR